MSMSEFEESLPDKTGPEDPLSRFSIHGQLLPDDFSEEDIAFAHELEFLLVPQQEQTPPYYVQTLLDSEDQRFQAVEPGFEKKVSVRVFRRLSLSRRLYRTHESPLRAMIKPLSPPRSLLATACLLFILLSIVVTGPAFSSGLSVLLSGEHSGVMSVQQYPTVASDASHQRQSSEPNIVAQREHINLQEAQGWMHFQMYWPAPNALPDNYALDKIYLYQAPNQDWADGPILELDYQYTSPGVTPLEPGRGKLAIGEFKPVKLVGDVYQVVVLGSAYQIEIDAEGQVYAIYINDKWTRINQSYEWQYGEHSALIYERDSVIFWIVGDQRDKIDNNALRSIASSLSVLDVGRAVHAGGIPDDVTSSYDGAPELFVGDIIYTNSTHGPSLIVEGDPSTLRNSIGVN